ncbi:hypothetical protein [Denitrobaculum tricleocarpae]|uniref:Uncharacterized protein n=1 Tax=Denitrobaculum tricleocarpae TaxID=2591009 RepID=A0A545TB30_9PROT|nr:hypothetical protein [Denitrobaculum tricleocarpae]TQV74425.1 hypothetical protein FKG95_24405 [Denitrobaculum tricleocarpae]
MKYCCFAVLLMISGDAAAQEVNYQALYKKAAVDLAQSEAMVGMLKKQTWAFRKLLTLHGIDFQDEVVIRNDAGIIVERINLTQDPVPAVSPRLTEKPAVN